MPVLICFSDTSLRERVSTCLNEIGNLVVRPVSPRAFVYLGPADGRVRLLETGDDAMLAVRLVKDFRQRHADSGGAAVAVIAPASVLSQTPELNYLDKHDESLATYVWPAEILTVALIARYVERSISAM